MFLLANWNADEEKTVEKGHVLLNQTGDILYWSEYVEMRRITMLNRCKIAPFGAHWKQKTVLLVGFLLKVVQGQVWADVDWWNALQHVTRMRTPKGTMQFLQKFSWNRWWKGRLKPLSLWFSLSHSLRCLGLRFHQRISGWTSLSEWYLHKALQIWALGQLGLSTSN